MVILNSDGQGCLIARHILLSNDVTNQLVYGSYSDSFHVLDNLFVSVKHWTNHHFYIQTKNKSFQTPDS